MTRLPHGPWNDRMVAAYLEEAAAIHRRLPEVRVPSYHTLWPETLKDDWERLYDAIHGKPHLGPPMPPEVSFHEETMAWLRWIPAHRQKIVWMRANRIPWKSLVDEFGKDRGTLWREMKFGLAQITAHLNAGDEAI